MNNNTVYLNGHTLEAYRMGWVADAPGVGARTANGRSFIQGPGDRERRGAMYNGNRKGGSSGCWRVRSFNAE